LHESRRATALQFSNNLPPAAAQIWLVQFGVVINHSLAGASDDYTRRFFTELPKTFNHKSTSPDRTRPGRYFR
jgi:hypothetical protein